MDLRKSRAELKLHPLKRLSEMMDYAQKIDEKNILINKDSAETISIGTTVRIDNNYRIVHRDTNGAANIVGEAGSLKTTGFFRKMRFRRFFDAENELTNITTVKTKEENHGTVSCCTNNGETDPHIHDKMMSQVSTRLQWDPEGPRTTLHHVHLEDKVNFKGGSIVRYKPLIRIARVLLVNR